jgi:hypothetical protein
MKAGHRKTADANCELFSPYMDHSLTLDQGNAKFFLRRGKSIGSTPAAWQEPYRSAG